MKNQTYLSPKFMNVAIGKLSEAQIKFIDDVIDSLNLVNEPFIEFLEENLEYVEAPYGYDNGFGKRLTEKFLNWCESRYPDLYVRLERIPNCFYKTFVHDIIKILKENDNKYNTTYELIQKFKRSKLYKINRFYFGFPNNIQFLDLSDLTSVFIPGGLGKVELEIIKGQEDISEWKVPWGYIVKGPRISDTGYGLTFFASVPNSPSPKKEKIKGIGILVSNTNVIISSIDKWCNRKSFVQDPSFNLNDDKPSKYLDKVLEASSNTLEYIHQANPDFVIIEYDSKGKEELTKEEQLHFEKFFYTPIKKYCSTRDIEIRTMLDTSKLEYRCIHCGSIVPDIKAGSQFGTCPTCKAKSIGAENRILNMLTCDSYGIDE